MMNKTKTILMIAALQLTATVALAQEERAYDASISLGYVGTSGNTETQTFNSEFLYTLRTISWTHNVKFQMLGSREEKSTTAEKYSLEDKSDYSLNDDSYLFVQGGYIDDRFSGFDYQVSLAAGYGRFLQKREGFSLQGYGGLGYRQSEVSNIGGEGEPIVSLGQNLEWQISENSKLTQSIGTEIGSDLIVSKFEIALEANIIGNIASRISFQARNNSEVPAGIEKTDTQTSISLAYTF